MNRSVIVFGPAGCGKTANAEALRQHFGMDRIVDGWNGSDAIPAHGALVLTNCTASHVAARTNSIPFNQAMKKAGVVA